MLLEFAIATELCVVNRWFTKEESKKVTYESGGTRTVVDYVLVRRKVLSAVKDMKVIRGEACLTQHKQSKKVTYESGGTRTVVDYVLVRRKVLSAVKDMKVIRGEACLT